MAPFLKRTLVFAYATGAATTNNHVLVSGKDFPNPSNVSELVDFSTPINTKRVIPSDHPDNADGNTMDFTYYVTQDLFGNTALFAEITTQIEIGTSGT